MINEYQKIINLLYSCGEELETIEEYYRKLLFYYGKMWDRKYGYIELIKVLSLAVLFEVDKADSSWIDNGTEFEFPKVYDCLEEIINAKKSLACGLLKEYLQEKWYDIHKECAWYNSHLSNKNIYCGYWSFEAGAIAKILKLDDSNLRDIQYYPYDLVHYK